MRMSDPLLAALNPLIPGGMLRGSVSINGRQLCWVETGSGEPTNVLEAGRNECSLSWALVIALLSRKRAHVIASDRAGVGCSDPASGEAIITRQVADLAVIIKHVAQGRCLLVGHSWAGVLAQWLAFEHPDLVSGLVLVDPAHEQMIEILPAFLQGMIRAFPEHVRPVLSVSGIGQFMQRRAAWQFARRLTEDQRTRELVIQAYRSCAGRPDELLGAASALSLLQRLRAASHPFPAIPVVILSASQRFPRRVREHWTALQANLAAMASQSKHIVVADAGHALPVYIYFRFPIYECVLKKVDFSVFPAKIVPRGALPARGFLWRFSHSPSHSDHKPPRGFLLPRIRAYPLSHVIDVREAVQRTSM